VKRNLTVDGETAMARKDGWLKNVLSKVSLAWKRRIAFAASAVAVVGLCFLIRGVSSDRAANAQLPNPFRGKQEPPQTSGTTSNAPANSEELPRVERPKHDVMAVVNGEDIRRDALATACVERFGEDVLEGLVNKRLILHHCRNRNIVVTDADIEAEIDKMAARFKIGREQWLQMLERERGINVQHYKRDILWPTIALRKCAADKLTVSDEELNKAYDSQYGAAMKCRLIVVNDRKLAEQIHQQAAQNPADFARLAMQHSQDVNSASIGGMIQPIRKHVGDPNIEKQVFAMQPNQVSSIIPVGPQFAILKCEGTVPARNVPMESVRAQLTEQMQEGKLRDEASKLFAELQSTATPQNVWNNPQLRQQYPGVVALINGEQIRYEELAEECLLRYGEEVLKVEISHMLLQQALTKSNIAISDQDLNEEIAHAAKLSGVLTKDGQPDVEKWVKTATEEQGVDKDEYMRDSVWPSAALKKLTSGAIEVSQDDIKKGFEANYAERVRCRAIVLGNMRRAQEVWGKARQNTSMDYFGDLAEEYSIEPSSKSLRGEVPPIQRYGGQPQLEDVAFELKPDELSGIIHFGDKFVILKCEGRTQPVKVNPQEVQEILYQDIYEKKLRVAMNEKFEEIRSRARIDNYLAGTSQAPDRVKDPAAAPNTTNTTEGARVDTAVRPTSAPQ
jgi:parvulin-like peptidyl-prolyl isomerase